MTKIKILGNRIIFDGHADTKQECETITLICDSLALSEAFQTIKYENGYAEFERIGGTNDLMFPPALGSLTINFDSNITQVVVVASQGTVTCTESGSSYDNGTYKFDYTPNPIFTVTLNSGYVIDTITVSDDDYGGTVTKTSDNTFTGSGICGGGNCTITITSKQGGASKQTIDVSTLSGWESLASGNHSITVKTKASGYADSAVSNAVTVSKAAVSNGYTLTVSLGYGYEGVDITYANGTTAIVGAGTYNDVVSINNVYNFANDSSNIASSYSIKDANGGEHKVPYTLTSNTTVFVSHCFVEGTLITLANGSVKPVENINYNDDILVWDFDNGVQSSAKPCWIAKPNVAPCYWEITLSDGTILKLVGANGKAHRLFNSRGKFVYPQDFENGEQTVKQDGSTPYIVKCEKVYKEVKYYNFATSHALNNYANGVLCGCRFSNVYPIENMKYIKNDRTLATREEYAEIPDKLFYGLRLAEQQNLDDNVNNVNYYHTMKEHVIHNYIEHERDYMGKSDYETWLFKQKK